MHFRRSLISTRIIILLLILASCQQENNSTDIPQGRSLEFISTVTFMDESGQSIISIETAVADDNASRASGLMDVYDLPADKGMFFIFENDSERSFWMANTPLPLDILFVNSNLEIIRIHRNTQPFSDRSITSEGPARYVIETNAGFTLEYDITEGMTIEFERHSDSED